jgi:hypothetical protein
VFAGCPLRNWPVFGASTSSGRDAFTSLTAGMIVASLPMAAGRAWGLDRRLAECR